MDSGLEAFSHNPTDGSFTALPMFRQLYYQLSEPTVPLVQSGITVAAPLHQLGKTNLSRDGLNPAHVPYKRVNNPTHGECCFTMIGRADIEGSKSNVAMNAWLPQASYPCGNFSDTSSLKLLKLKDR